MRQEYFELFDWLEQSKPAKPEDFFDRMRAAYGIAHLVYIDVVPSSRSALLHRLHHTLSRDQVESFSGFGLNGLIPLLKLISSSVKPVDHATLRQRIPIVEALFAHAERLDIPVEGISYPLLSQPSRAASLSISMALASGELSPFLRNYGRDIQTLASIFHAAMIETDTPRALNDGEPGLITPREREVLRWSAAGKSYWEIAVILGISERTVRFFMSNARQKLDVVSNTQAVAEAVWRGLIQQ